MTVSCLEDPTEHNSVGSSTGLLGTAGGLSDDMLLRPAKRCRLGDPSVHFWAMTGKIGEPLLSPERLIQ